jgi:hypothetical protein
MSPESLPVPASRRLLLGVTKPQMVFAFLGGVAAYMLISFTVPGLTDPRWGPLSWRDLITFAVVIAIWTGTALYNRAHPDEEVRLNLNG